MIITKLLGFLKAPKLLMGLFVFILLVVCAKQIMATQYDAGFTAATQEMQVEYNKQLRDVIARYAKRVAEAQQKQQQHHEAEIARLTHEVEVKKHVEEVIKYITVDKPIPVPAECTDMVKSVNSLHNEAYRIINTSSANGTPLSYNSPILTGLLRPPNPLQF